MSMPQLRFRLAQLLTVMFVMCVISAVLWTWHPVISLSVTSVSAPFVIAMVAFRTGGYRRAFCIGALLPSCWFLVWGGGLSAPAVFLDNVAHTEQLRWFAAAFTLTLLLTIATGLFSCLAWRYVKSEW